MRSLINALGRTTLSSLCFTLGVVWLASGCSGGVPKGSLDGKVTFKGQPVTRGEVQFLKKEAGIGASAKLNSSGNFSVPSLEAGTYAVCVTPPQAEEAAVKQKGPEYLDIPQKARDFSTSGLSVTIQAGKNEATFDLSK